MLTGIETLKARRGKLWLNFAKKCVKSNLDSDMFPMNETKINTRKPEKYYVHPAKTDRLANFAIPRLLNSHVK
jgi:hypothetical protein